MIIYFLTNSTFRKNQSRLTINFRKELHIEEETTRFLIKRNKQDKNKFDIDIMLYREFLNRLIEEISPSLTSAFIKAKKEFEEELSNDQRFTNSKNNYSNI